MLALTDSELGAMVRELARASGEVVAVTVNEDDLASVGVADLTDLEDQIDWLSEEEEE